MTSAHKTCPDPSCAREMREQDSFAFCPDCRFPLKLLEGKYRFERKLGEGGFGVVYLALHLGLQQHRAIKLLQLSRLFDSDAKRDAFTTRFQREVQSIAALSHCPGIVTLHDAGYDPALGHYSIMEHLDGQPLSQLLRSAGTLEWPAALSIAIELCQVVSQIHAEGVVHRDLKPDNVMLVSEANGQAAVKLIDFGISRVLLEELDVDETTQVVGTPEYMSPEQCRGKGVGHATDIYALGAIAYRMLAGASPFADRDNAMAVMMAQLTEPAPALSLRCDDLPPGLEQEVMRALSKEPEDRHPSAEALAYALQEFYTHPVPLPQTAPELLLPHRAEPLPSALVTPATSAYLPRPVTSAYSSPAPVPALEPEAPLAAAAPEPEATGASTPAPAPQRSSRWEAMFWGVVLVGTLLSFAFWVHLGPQLFSTHDKGEEPSRPPASSRSAPASSRSAPAARGRMAKGPLRRHLRRSPAAGSPSAGVPERWRPAPERPLPSRPTNRLKSASNAAPQSKAAGSATRAKSAAPTRATAARRLATSPRPGASGSQRPRQTTPALRSRSHPSTSRARPTPSRAAPRPAQVPVPSRPGSTRAPTRSSPPKPRRGKPARARPPSRPGSTGTSVRSSPKPPKKPPRKRPPFWAKGPGKKKYLCRSYPSGATLHVDGVMVGKTPLHLWLFPRQRYTLQFRKKGYLVPGKSVWVPDAGQLCVIMMVPNPFADP